MKIDPKIIDRTEITVSMPEAWKYSWEIVFPTGEIERIKSRFLKSYGSRLDMPGFRKGKIPISMIKQQFGDSLDSAFVEELGAGILSRLKERDQLTHIHDAQYNLDTDPQGNDVLIIEGEVVPGFNLTDYKGLNATMQKQKVTDDAVTAFIDQIRESHSELRPKDGALEMGDVARIKMRKVAPGGVVLVGEEEKTINVSLAENAIPAELLSALLGKSTGARFDIPLPVARSEMIERPDTKDTQESYAIQVEETYAVKIPDDDAIGDIFGLDDPDEIPIRSRIILEDQAEDRARQGVRKELVTRIARQTEIPLPPTMVRERAEEYRKSYLQRAEEEGREPEQELTDESYFFDKFREQIELVIKEIFVIDKIADVENLYPTRSEWETAVGVLAKDAGLTPKAMSKKLGSEGTESLMRRITRSKVERFIEDEADIDIVEYTHTGETVT